MWPFLLRHVEIMGVQKKKRQSGDNTHQHPHTSTHTHTHTHTHAHAHACTVRCHSLSHPPWLWTHSTGSVSFARTHTHTHTHSQTHTQETGLLIVQWLISRVSARCVSVGRRRWSTTLTSLKFHLSFTQMTFTGFSSSIFIVLVLLDIIPFFRSVFPFFHPSLAFLMLLLFFVTCSCWGQSKVFLPCVMLCLKPIVLSWQTVSITLILNIHNHLLVNLYLDSHWHNAFCQNCITKSYLHLNLNLNFILCRAKKITYLVNSSKKMIHYYYFDYLWSPMSETFIGLSNIRF